VGKVKDLTGNKYGRLTVIEQHGFTEPNKRGQRHAIWYCRCDCGNYVERTTDVLKRGKSSCGCRQKEVLRKMSEINTTHNMTSNRLYRIYKGMVGRCYYPSTDRYSCYGGRGIKICNEWLKDRSKFFEWALKNGYHDNLTIDRIDVDGDYCPENCRWVSKEEQYKNRRQNIMITYNRKTLCAEDWSKLTGIKAQTIRWRYKHGWEIDKIFSK